jgi:hypothetical protein
MKRKRYQLGILLVHGFGSQRAGETLVHWGDALIRGIAFGTQSTVAATVRRADIRWPRADAHVEAILTLRSRDDTEQWLMAEGWWADAFPPPSYRELVSWSVRALPWAVAAHIAQRHWHTKSCGDGWRRVLSRTITITQLVIALMVAPLLIGVLGVSVLLGALPIPQLRTVILAMQSTLTATVGDSLAFVESPIRARSSALASGTDSIGSWTVATTRSW